MAEESGKTVSAKNAAARNREKPEPLQNIFIIGAKSIGQYGGFETFLDKLTEVHQSDRSIRYYIVTKANGSGAMDETRLSSVSDIKKDAAGEVRSFRYHGANVIKLHVPQIGEIQAVIYDVKAFCWCLRYIDGHGIGNAVIYVLGCRIGPFFGRLVSEAHQRDVRVYVNPDGHEWKRDKWPGPVRWYWKKSEGLMVKHADRVICDSVNIEKYIKEEYSAYTPSTVYIAYGADVEKSGMADDDPRFTSWMKEHGLRPGSYYMCCGRFVPENSFDIMIREFMKSGSRRDLVFISTKNDRLLRKYEEQLHWRGDGRIRFAGTVYDPLLLKKIRENAYGNIHGHTVGGTNPSLLEALGSTKLNLLIDVVFNRETAKDAAMYWSSAEGELAKLIGRADRMRPEEREELGRRAKKRIREAYNWPEIGNEYRRIWLS
ncbi:MAG: DUF1972 domain-containing protein [Lachnospiraceae bacterium]|nr:DUF1972 domain-containing protein [Lachnospiraceae bacterium]